ncbi:hypothetical protein ACWEQL_24910 [Kitasatospora sp. NPDC004240]
MADGSGYGIRSAGAEGQAASLGKAAESVGTIRTAVADPLCYVPDVFGGEDAGPAYTAFAAAWQAESATIRGALDELAGKVRTSSANYQNADAGVVDGLRTAAAGGEHRPFG